MDSSTLNKDKIFFSDKLVRFINRVRNSEISSIQPIVSGILNATGNPDTCTKELKKIIQLDPPLASAVLKTANSALFTPRGSVADISQAIIRLGFKTITEIALSQKVCQIFRNGDGPLNRKHLWINSVGTAVLAREIARKEFGVPGGDLYAAGLMHRLGMIVMDQYMHEEYAEIIHAAANTDSLRDAELRIAGFGHTEVGAVLTESWNLPEQLIMGIRFYQEPLEAPEEFRKDLMILHVADIFCRNCGLGLSGKYSIYEGNGEYEECLKQLDICETTLEMLVNTAEEEIHVLSEMGQ